MNTVTTEVKPLKVPTIKQLLSRKWQGSKQHSEESKENYERAGIVVFRQQLLIDVKQQPSADDDNRLVKLSRECLKRDVSCKIVPDTVSDYHGTPICAMVEYEDDLVSICEVNDMYRRTAENIGNVVEWHNAPHEWAPAIIGIDAAGHRRAVIACITDNR